MTTDAPAWMTNVTTSHHGPDNTKAAKWGNISVFFPHDGFDTATYLYVGGVFENPDGSPFVELFHEDRADLNPNAIPYKVGTPNKGNGGTHRRRMIRFCVSKDFHDRHDAWNSVYTEIEVVRRHHWRLHPKLDRPAIGSRRRPGRTKDNSSERDPGSVHAMIRSLDLAMQRHNLFFRSKRGSSADEFQELHRLNDFALVKATFTDLTEE